MLRKMLIITMALAVLASIVMPATAQIATRPGMPGHANEVISALQTRPDLSQFTNALKQSNLYNTINSGGTYTVFAPTNDAFSRIPAAKASIMNQNQQGMDYVLGYHIATGKLTLQQLKSTGSLDTLIDRSVPVSTAGNQIMVDGARIIGDGMDTGNAMIYPIDTVMVPPMLT